MSSSNSGETSAVIRERVLKARGIQNLRWSGSPTCNARMQSRDLQTWCPMDDTTQNLLRRAMEELELSARAYDRILKVSRTIADLADSQTITAEHVSEAIQYRTLDRQIWT
jgi:magnesium chelatase family protein